MPLSEETGEGDKKIPCLFSAFMHMGYVHGGMPEGCLRYAVDGFAL